MIRNNADPNLNYYLKEMAYLHRISRVFAAKHPKIAERLEIGQGEFSDPHIARMMESFAYLTARLQRDIDDQFPRISSALLGVLYPHLTRPTPPMSIAQFQVDTLKGTLTTKYEAVKGTKLFTHTKDNQVCRFRTCYDVDLWPVEVTDVTLVRSSDYTGSELLSNKSRMLRIKIRSVGGSLSFLGIDRLRFYINAPEEVSAHTLYEGIFSYEGRVGYAGQEDYSVKPMPPGTLRPVGFGEHEGLTPYPHSSNLAYRLLQEYFTFPQKFFFLDLHHLDVLPEGDEVTLFLPVDNGDKIAKMDLSPQTFLLGCTPIVNLFSKTSEPIRLDEKSVEYKVTPDYRDELSTEIYSIEKVSAANDERADVDIVYPYFWLNYEANLADQKLFWHGRREKSGRVDVPGTDVYLSFIDQDLNPYQPPQRTLFAHTLCTNRMLAARMPIGSALSTEDNIPATNIVCLLRPTDPVYPPEDGETQWDLISQLSLNHLSLSNETVSLSALKKILLVHADACHRTHTLDIDSIEDIRCTPALRRTTQDAWRGFVRGTAVELSFNETLHEDATDFLLACVLNTFFSLYCSLNSFTELRIYSKQRKGVWKSWPPHAGSKTLL